MKAIAVEEHYATPTLIDAWGAVDARHRDETTDLYRGPLGSSLVDLADARLAWMDEMGVDVQVLSLTMPGAQGLDPGPAVELARHANDVVAETMRTHPDRFQGLAALPTPDPAAAADELRRAVGELGLQGGMTFGRTRGRHLDHPDNEPLFAAAHELRAPLFVHPQIPARAVRDSLYSALPRGLDFALASAGLGWHYEAGVQVLRLVLAGVFDRYPDLRIVLGHWGDLLVFYLEEIDVIPRLARLDLRPISEYFKEHVYVASSGTLSHRYLGWAIDVLGADHVLLALDYPFVPRRAGDVRTFLEQAPIGGVGREKLASRNWEGLVERIRS